MDVTLIGDNIIHPHMVKKNRDGGIHAPSRVLEPKDKDIINGRLKNTPVEAREMKISNPMNDLEGLYIQIKSDDREDLFDDEVHSTLRDIADALGYKGEKMDRGNFPSKKEPTSYDDETDTYYTLAIWFHHRK